MEVLASLDSPISYDGTVRFGTKPRFIQILIYTYLMQKMNYFCLLKLGKRSAKTSQAPSSSGQLSSMESDGACVSCVSMSNSMHSTVLDQVVEGYGVTSCVEQVILKIVKA